MPKIKDISNEYINWLCFASAGMLDRGNLYCFNYAIENLPSNAPIVEIGSFCGLSTNAITYYKEKWRVKNRLITCEPWKFEGIADESAMVGDSSMTHVEYRMFIKETYLRNIRMFNRYDLPHTIEMNSDEFFSRWSNSEEVTDILGRNVKLGGAISFCYVDGNHTYEYARRDFDNCHDHLEQDGFILFDDSADGSGWGVCTVIEEIKKSKKYKLIIKNPNYLFKKK